MITPDSEKGYIITTEHPAMARAVQCVLVGYNNLEAQLSGIAHIHYNADYEKILDNFFNETIKQMGNLFELKIGGGVNFNRGGFDRIPGNQTAEKVMNYLITNSLDSRLTGMDLYGKHPREMEIVPKQPSNHLILRSDLLHPVVG